MAATATCRTFTSSSSCATRSAAPCTRARRRFSDCSSRATLDSAPPDMDYLLWHAPAESARRFPDRAAVQDAATTFTHRELHELSNGVARLLTSRGLTRGDRVGMWMPKQARSVAVMLGVSKCGGIYVPVDPQAPVERAAFILGNADISVLVTSRRLLASLSQQIGTFASLRAVLVVDDQSTELSPSPVPSFGWGSVVPAVDAPEVANTVDS